MIPFTLRQLAYFVAAAEQGSVAGAARALNISQPSISAAIARLEAVFAVQLFVRHHARGVVPTAIGRRLLGEARGLLAQAEEIGESVHELGRTMRGRLAIGCFVTFAPLYMPNLIMRFTTDHPGTELRLSEGYHDDLFEGLESATLDLALLYDFALPPQLEVRPLAAFPPYALLPASHRLARADAVSLRQLVPEPMVLLDQRPSRDYFTSLFRGYGLEPEIRFLSPSLETVRGLVGNGHGYSLLVTRPTGDVTYDGHAVVAVPIAEPVEPGRIVIAYPAGTRPTHLARAFVDYATAWFRRMT